MPRGQKYPPPRGFTGKHGQDPNDYEIDHWVRTSPGDNVALRYPDGVLGLDVDNYGGRPAARTLADHENRLGQLPPTWMITSRNDGISGTRLYRAEPGRRWH